MSNAVVKEKGATVLAVATDIQNMFPPLCQILKALCCSPACCSVFKGLMQRSAVGALGTVQIMVGLFNIGLGPGRISTRPGDLASWGAAYWLGAVYMVAGIVSIFANRIPTIFSVGFAVFVNIVGSLSSIGGITLYAMDLAETSVVAMCNWSGTGVPTDDDNCRYVAFLTQSLLTGMDITLIVLAVLQLCICASLAVMCMWALMNRAEEEGVGDVEIHQPVLKELLVTCPSA